MLLEELAWSFSVTIFKIKQKSKLRSKRNICKLLTKGNNNKIFEEIHRQRFHNVAVDISVFEEGALQPTEITRLKRKDTHHI